VKFAPRPFQKVAAEHAIAFLSEAAPGRKQAYAAPTGVGKSVVELLVREAFPDLWIVTPREEIIYGLLDKLGVDPCCDPIPHRICTPVKLRNMLMQGHVRPGKLIFDEAHHHNAETWQQLDLLTGLAPSVAYTATPYRGSPKGTREWLEMWGEPLWLITFKEAVAEKFIRLPTFAQLPLVDDDVVSVTSGGDFDVKSIDSVTVDRLGDLAQHAKRWYDGDRWDRSTVFSCPSSTTSLRLQQELARLSVPTAIISAETPTATRRQIFQACRERIFALLHINIVSEGVDEPFRRLVDLSPTMSPVKWVQQLGRITRPADDAPPEYWCTNRNLLRHCYALDGMVPVSSIVEAEAMLPPTTRRNVRVLGMEAVGRFKPTSVKMLDGATVDVYTMSVLRDMIVHEYACIVHPMRAEPLWATKISKVNEDRTRDWGTWLLCPAPDGLSGFASVPPKEVSPKQSAWWTKPTGARRYGIDPNQPVTKKNFTILPVLSNVGGWPD